MNRRKKNQNIKTQPKSHLGLWVKIKWKTINKLNQRKEKVEEGIW